MTLLQKRIAVSWITGTEAVPVAEAAFKVHDFDQNVEKSVDLPDAGLQGAYQTTPNIPGGRFMDYGFKTQLRGSDTADVPPAEGALLRSSGFIEIENGTTPNIGYKYALGDLHLNSGLPSGDVYPRDIRTHCDGKEKLSENCVLDMGVLFEAGKIPVFTWKIRGTVVATSKGYTYGTMKSFPVVAFPRPSKNAALSVAISRTALADVTGYVSGASSTTVLIDSSATFITSGILPGDTVTLTVGAETADVISVDSEIQLTTEELSTAGSYDATEAYTIVKADYTSTGLVVPKIEFTCGNVIDPRDDINGPHGFSPPIHTSRDPYLNLQVEIPSASQFNFEREFAEGTEMTVIWKHEVGGGDRHELTCATTVVMESFPNISENNGKMIYDVKAKQSITVGATPFEMSWQGT